MRVLLVGAGAREHALASKLRDDPSVAALYAVPGNPGIAGVATCLARDPNDPDSLLDVAERERIDLTVVGPELPLTRGVADAFAARGRVLCGPTYQAAALESSKAFAKDFMTRHGVPTARYRVCETAQAARDVLASGALGLPVVVKADGLAAGKGVTVAADRATAEAAVADAMENRRFGDAGSRLVLEECLVGREASFFVLTDGTRAIALGSAEDHKRAYDDDRGPNTGGMGAFAPSPLIDRLMEAQVMDSIVRPVIDGMRREGHPYRGFLYVGLMITSEGPKVVEFNARMGDPEAQVVLPGIADPLAPLLRDAATGTLTERTVAASRDVHVGVVLASGGYPGAFEKGKPISGLEEAASRPGILIFHAGTAWKDGVLVTAGGRVLTVVARGATYQEAVARAYDAARSIRFDGIHMRLDIGRRAIQSGHRGSSE